MEFQEYLNQPNLRPFIKKFRAEDYLFRQGQMGNTMFIVVEGKVELIAEADQGEHVEAILGPGHFLGEKAMLQDSPYQRLFGARAAEITKVLELSGKDVQEIQRTAPLVMSHIFRQAFQIAVERLYKANYLVRILRSSNNMGRFVECLVFFCRTSGKRVAEGVEVQLSIESFYRYLDMEKSEIYSALNGLVGLKLVIRKEDPIYLVPDENALLAYSSRWKGAA